MRQEEILIPIGGSLPEQALQGAAGNGAEGLHYRSRYQLSFSGSAASACLQRALRTGSVRNDIRRAVTEGRIQAKSGSSHKRNADIRARRMHGSVLGTCFRSRCRAH